MKVQLLNKDAMLPKRANEGDAGYDLFSCEDTTVGAHSRKVIKTGISISIPYGTYARVAPRSGLAVKNGIDVGAGVIDESYRGEVGVVLFNHSDTDFQIEKGDRIAQLILTVIMTPDVVEVNELNNTERGTGGFGSTGK